MTRRWSSSTAPGRIAGSDANFRKAKEICSDQLVLVEFAREYKLQNLAGRLFVTGFKELLRGGTQNFRAGRAIGIGAIGRNLGIQRAEMRGNLQFERN